MFYGCAFPVLTCLARVCSFDLEANISTQVFVHNPSDTVSLTAYVSCEEMPTQWQADIPPGETYSFTHWNDKPLRCTAKFPVLDREEIGVMVCPFEKPE